ncbi:threonine aspartase 1 [Phlebotomus argentipes]|uniref:threonine aspartase 1 n=1 Tax=Phlebotomus argentipes TaxID=94469 RepID=UPI002893365F|nr:threonine aspartase 1 [Phlebotomus argentipes]
MVGFVAVHTGAGNCINEVLYRNVCRDACTASVETLRSGGSALDACEVAITHLENSPSTNAGFGSNLTWDRTIECDASIMDGQTLNFGACTNVSDVKNPIKLARCVCDLQSKTLAHGRVPPMVVSGEGASKIAKEMGVSLVEDPEELISEKALNCFNHFKGKVNSWAMANNTTHSSPLDTVGAVCVDGDGNISAGCSSGGIILKTSGRVGQAATYGAGCWAMADRDRCVATCTTGMGEYLMKTLLAREIVNDLINCQCPVTSLNKTFKERFLDSPYLKTPEPLYAGALTILYDRTSGTGDVLWSHTTAAMCIGYMGTSFRKPKFICSELPMNCKSGRTTVVSGKQFTLPT